MIDAVWIGGIFIMTAVASYTSTVVGLVCIVAVVVAATTIWAVAAGNMLVPVAIVIPSIVGFVGGRAFRRVKSAA